MVRPHDRPEEFRYHRSSSSTLSLERDPADEVALVDLATGDARGLF